ncbi:MAG: heparan-alpha-glucosaminide N-acetyltransferase domain-containing protein [Acidobacteriota bacterium]
MGGTKSGGGQRFGFVDLLRGLALIVMVETHVVNAYLPKSARECAFFFWLSFVNGLVAPSFLFASGFSLILQARRKWEDFLHSGPAFRKHLRRMGFILLAAYFLHLPHFGLSRYLAPQNQAFWKSAFQVDVLQCIVVSLLVIDALIFLTRKPKVHFWAVATIGVAATLLTPWIWAQDFTTRLPLPLAMFLNPHGVSLFPIFPWISFVAAGSCAAMLFLEAVEKRVDERFMARSFWLAAAAIAAALLARGMPLFHSWNVDFYKISPLYVLIRLGCVMILCTGLYAMEKRLGWVPNAIRLAGQESLLVYCAHLLLIFSVLRRPPVSMILGREAGYGFCFLISAVLILLMLCLAAVWHGWKGGHPHLAKLVPAGLVAVNLIIFLLL